MGKGKDLVFLNGLNILRFIIAVAEAVLTVALLIYIETQASATDGFLHRGSESGVNPASKVLWSRIQQRPCPAGSDGLGAALVPMLADQYVGAVTEGYRLHRTGCAPVSAGNGSDAVLARSWFHDGTGRTDSAETVGPTHDYDAYCKEGHRSDLLACALGADVLAQHGASLFPTPVVELGLVKALAGAKPKLGTAWPLQSVNPAVMCLTGLWVSTSFSVFTFNTGMLAVNVWVAVGWNVVGALYVWARAAGGFHAAPDVTILCTWVLALAAAVQTLTWLSRAGVKTRTSAVAKKQLSSAETRAIFIGPISSSDTVGHCVAQTYLGLAMTMPLVSTAVMASAGASSSLPLRTNFVLVHAFFLCLTVAEYVAYSAQQVKRDAQSLVTSVPYLGSSIPVPRRFVMNRGGFSAAALVRRRTPDENPEPDSDTEPSENESDADIEQIELIESDELDHGKIEISVGSRIYLEFTSQALGSLFGLAMMLLLTIFAHGYWEMGDVIYYTLTNGMPVEYDARWLVYLYSVLAALAVVYMIFAGDTSASAALSKTPAARARRKHRRQLYAYCVTLLAAGLTAVPMSLVAFDPKRLSVGFSGKVPGVTA